MTAGFRPTLTGIVLEGGDKVQIVASGKWCREPEPSCAGPDGDETAKGGEGCNLPLPGAPRGALIGLIGDGREIFRVGSSVTYQVPDGVSGELMLMMNDCMGLYGDNSGQLDVSIRRVVEVPVLAGGAALDPAIAQILSGRPVNREWIERTQPPELAKVMPHYQGELEREPALKLLEEAAATGHPIAEAWLGRWLVNESDPQGKDRGNQLLRRNILALREEAAKGDGNAMFLLAWLHAKGLGGVEKSTTEAVRWYEAGAGVDHPLCLTNLAVGLFNTGDDIPDDFPRAVGMYTRAAELGIPTAVNNLGVAYENGKGVSADARIAFLLMEFAATRGNESAMAALARYYRDGIGTEKNAFEQLRWEARQGWAKAEAERRMVGPFLRIQGEGQIGKVNALAYSPDGRLLYAAGEDKVVHVWEADTGRLKSTHRLPVGPGANGGIVDLDCSPSGRFLAVGADNPFHSNSLVYILDVASGEILDVGVGHKTTVRSVRFSPGGRRLATTSGTNTGGYTAVVWSVSDGGKLAGEAILEGHTSSVWDVAWIQENPGRIVTASLDKTLRIWTEQPDGTWSSQELVGHSDEVIGVDVTPDGSMIVSASADGTLRGWDARTGEFLRVIFDRGQKREALFGVAVNPSGDVIAASGAKRMFRVSDAGQLLLEYVTNQLVDKPVWNPRQPALLASNTGGWHNDIYVTSLEKNERIFEGLAGYVYSVASRENSILWGSTYEYRHLNERGPLEYEFSMDLLQVIPVADPSGAQRAVPTVNDLSLAMPQSEQLSVLKGDTVVSTFSGPRGIGLGAATFLGEDMVATTGFMGPIIINPQDGKVVRWLSGHEGGVNALAPVDGGRLLVSGSNDCTWRLWNPVSGQLLLSFYMDRNREWVAWSPQGYYACSTGGDRLIGWAVNRGFGKIPEFHDASRFQSQFERPDVIGRIFQHGDVGLAIAEANKARQGASTGTETALDIREDYESLAPPEVSFVIPAAGQSVRDEMIDVIVRVDPGKSGRGVKDAQLLVNGRPQRAVGRISRETLDAESLGKRLITHRVQLMPGRNTLTAIATNELAISNLTSIDIDFEQPASAEKVPACLYALCIGVGDYMDDNYDLPAAGSDARRIAESLKEHGGRLFSKVETRLVVDGDATGGNVLDALEWLERSATQHDVAVLYVGGHGIQDEMEHYYFLPHDYDPERLRRTGVRWTEFERTVEAIPGRLLFFLDTCQAGGVTGSGVQSRKFRGPDAVRNAIRDLARDEVGAVVMSATTSEGAAQESDAWGGGAFTTALIEGIGGSADHASSPDGIITIKELDLFVTMRVKELTNGTQPPTTLFPITVTDFPLTQNKQTRVSPPRPRIGLRGRGIDGMQRVVDR